MSEDKPKEKKLSKRIYLYWAVALGLLIAAVLVSWLVVVPHWVTRRIICEVASSRAEDGLTPPLPAKRRQAWSARELEPLVVKRLGGHKKAARELTRYMALPDWWAPRKDIAALSLGQCRTREAVPALVQALDHENHVVRDRAIEALGMLGAESKDAVPDLVRLLESPDTRLRAIAALAGIGKPALTAVPALERLLKDTDYMVRLGAARSILDLRGKSADAFGTLLWSLEKGKGAHERRTAVMQLFAVIGLNKYSQEAKPAVPILAAALSDKDGVVRYHAVRTLLLIGPTAREAIPALEGALQDRDPDVRKAAAEALKKIRASAPPP